MRRLRSGIGKSEANGEYIKRYQNKILYLLRVVP